MQKSLCFILNNDPAISSHSLSGRGEISLGEQGSILGGGPGAGWSRQERGQERGVGSGGRERRSGVEVGSGGLERRERRILSGGSRRSDLGGCAGGVWTRGRAGGRERGESLAESGQEVGSEVW